MSKKINNKKQKYFASDTDDIEKSKYNYKQLIEKSLQGVVVVQDFKIVYANPAFSKITGFTVEELTSFNPEQTLALVHPDDQERIWGNLKKRLAGIDLPPHYQFKGLHKDGTKKILDLYVVKIEFEGKPALQGFIIDITEQVEAQEYLKSRTKLIETILDNLPFGVVVTEIDSGKAAFINREFEEIHGWAGDELPDLKTLLKRLRTNKNKGKKLDTNLVTDVKSKNPENMFWDNIEVNVKSGEKRYLTAKNIPLYDQNLMIFTVRDVTERVVSEMQIQNSLNEKEILLREIHHRVKNNLQTISSLLDLQSESIKDKKVIEAFKSTQNRIRSMALIHERLYKSENLSRIKACEYISSLIEYLESTFIHNINKIKLHSKIQHIYLNLDIAIPCGLIINELVSNSMKYAFPDNSSGTIEVELGFKDKNNLILRVTDDGIGISPGIKIENSSTLGLQLVYLLAKQINGKIIVRNTKGTSIEITFPKSSFITEVETEDNN